MENDKYLLDSEKVNLRECVLKRVFDKDNDDIISSPILNALGLDVYDKSDSFFTRLNKGVKQSYLDKNIILTDEQMDCLDLLYNADLFISAPTSFGKTFVALEYISRNIKKLNNIIIIVPTLALMNELRKKCFAYFGDVYKIITSDAELNLHQYSEKKLMILVPERINSNKFRHYLNQVSIDLAIYDEIYKLDSGTYDNSRLITLNYTYKYLMSNSKKILLLGPFIKDVSFERSKRIINRYITNLNLVYNVIHKIEKNNINLDSNYCKQFIYFKSPKSISKFINEFDISQLRDVEYDSDIINWMCKYVHDDWIYIDFLKKGIGIHHGNTPIFLRKYIEEEYSNGTIHTILCTSTLIEGINTPTNKLIIYDCPRTPFELNNLIGRVGRLNVNEPKKGEIYFTNQETEQMFNSEKWIELNILYENEKVLSNKKEDECLYLEKYDDKDSVNEMIIFFDQVQELFQINKSEITEYGIEYKVFKNFVDNFDTLKEADSLFKVLKIIKINIISESIEYLSGLGIKKYSFYDKKKDPDRKFLKIDPVNLLLTLNSVKEVITSFVNLYPRANKSDINLFIDTVFKAKEFISFKLTKIIPIYQLFDSHNLLPKTDFNIFRLN